MRRKFVNVLALVCALAIAFFAVGCNDTKEPGKEPEQPAPVAKEISITGKATNMNVGAELQLGYEITPSGVEGAEVEWSVLPADVATVTGGGLLKGVKDGDAIVTATVKGTQVKDSFTIHVQTPHVAKPITAIQIADVTLKHGETKILELTPTPADCDAYELEFSYEDDETATVNKTVTGYVVSTLKEGAVEVTATVKGSEPAISCTFDITVSGDVDSANGVETETFKRGEIVNTWYEGRFFNIGARADSQTVVPVTLAEDGVHAQMWTKGNGRIMFAYNGTLDFTGDKKYIARVSVVTPSNFPQAGYVMMMGRKDSDAGSYKEINAGADIPMTIDGGGTSRTLISGKGETNYFYFMFDSETPSKEFYIQFFADANKAESKPGMTADIRVSKVEMIDLSVDDGYVSETFDDTDITVNDSKKTYQGTNFDIAMSGGDKLELANTFKASSLNPYASEKSLLWTTARVWKKGITKEETDKPSETIVQMKAVITYKGAEADKAYHVRVPMFVVGANTTLVEKTYIEMYYATASGEKALITKTVNSNNTFVLFEADVPADGNWNGQIVLRLYNEEATQWAQGNKTYCYFDGIAVKAL